MRKIVLSVSFLLCSVGVMASQWFLQVGRAQPTCDGTKSLTEKCNKGIVPNGYIEMGTCQGKVNGAITCSKVIAFNIRPFYCSTTGSLNTSTTPPSYTTYCADYYDDDCTHTRLCNQNQYNVYNSQGQVIGVYTECTQAAGQPQITKRLIKVEYTANGSPGYKCTAGYPAP